jgi:hypothetical protein
LQGSVTAAGRNEYGKAIRERLAAVAVRRTLDSWRNIACLSTSWGKTDEAQALYETYLKLSPSGPYATGENGEVFSVFLRSSGKSHFSRNGVFRLSKSARPNIFSKPSGTSGGVVESSRSAQARNSTEFPEEQKALISCRRFTREILGPVVNSHVGVEYPLTGWYDPDVIGIDVGITMLMAENQSSNFVWNTFMANPEAQSAFAAVQLR